MDNKKFELPIHWSNELRELFFVAGFDAVVDKLIEWFKKLKIKN